MIEFLNFYSSCNSCRNNHLWDVDFDVNLEVDYFSKEKYSVEGIGGGRKIKAVGAMGEC